MVAAVNAGVIYVDAYGLIEPRRTAANFLNSIRVDSCLSVASSSSQHLLK